MQLARWVFWDAHGRPRTILVDAANEATRVEGVTLRVDASETLVSDGLLFPLAIARETPRENVRAFERAVLSFSPAVDAEKAVGREAEGPALLLHYGELLATWAGLCPAVGLSLDAIEAVEFGRVSIALSPSDARQGTDAGVALGLLAVALEELCAQRGLVANGMRLDEVSGDETLVPGHWGIHLAKSVASDAPQG